MIKNTTTLDRTDINNNNYNNDNNNLLTTNKNNIKLSRTQVNSNTSFSSFDTKEVKELEGGSNINLRADVLPDNVKFIKAELFDNSKDLKKQNLKISLSICKNGKIGKANAGLNCPFRHIKRGLDSDIWNHSAHYDIVRSIHADLTGLNASPRASKCYSVIEDKDANGKKSGKQGKHIKCLSVVLGKEDDGSFICVVVYQTQKIIIALKGGDCLSKKQKSVGIIGTGTVTNSIDKKGLEIDDIF